MRSWLGRRGVALLALPWSSCTSVGADTGKDIGLVGGQELELGIGSSFETQSFMIYLYDKRGGEGLCGVPLPRSYISFHVPSTVGEYPLALGDSAVGDLGAAGARPGSGVNSATFVSDAQGAIRATDGKVILKSVSATVVVGRVELSVDGDDDNVVRKDFVAQLCSSTPCGAACELADCQVQTGKCAACSTQTDCSGTTPYCDPGTQTCVQCVEDGDCPDGVTCDDGQCVADAVRDSGAGAGSNLRCSADVDCSVETPACNRASGECVECLDDSHCSPAAPACNGVDQHCVQCTADSDCPGTAGCDHVRLACIECLGDGDCAAERPYCSVDAGSSADNHCIECLTNDDCMDPSASLCLAGACTPCLGDGDCAHIPGANVCDQGTCGECSAANEVQCDGFSCDPVAHGCTSTSIGSLPPCTPCLADSECSAQYGPARCVAMEFDGNPRELSYCLSVHEEGSNCEGRWLVPTPERVSRSGAAAAAYCGVNESLTTCEVVTTLHNGCAIAEDCCPTWAPDCDAIAQGARCNYEQCTYLCESDSECLDSSCVLGATEQICVEF